MQYINVVTKEPPKPRPQCVLLKSPVISLAELLT